MTYCFYHRPSTSDCQRSGYYSRSGRRADCRARESYGACRKEWNLCEDVRIAEWVLEKIIPPIFLGGIILQVFRRHNTIIITRMNR